MHYRINSKGESVPLTESDMKEMQETSDHEDKVRKEYLWELQMMESDSVLPRILEDVIDLLGIEKFPNEVSKAYNKKKILRKERPR